MRVFKFGGASVKDAKAIRNMCTIVENFGGKHQVVVISAIGKTTNALEELIDLAMGGSEFQNQLQQLKTQHLDITRDLFQSEDSPTSSEVKKLFEELGKRLQSSFPEFEKFYDSIVCFGEFLSTKIIADYLQQLGHPALLIPAPTILRTNDVFKEARVDWDQTEQLIKAEVLPLLEKHLVISQGFIGGTSDNEVTTLGREGSDFTAAIFASCLGCEQVTIWKDVPGILNADPKIIPEATLFNELPYNEASEMTYYGASVIHPKTIKPLAIKNIPLFVKSFDNPDQPGTCIHDCAFENPATAIIFKKDQCLFSFKVVDFTFVNEDAISKIFGILHDLNIKINIMQNSAISFSICFDYNKSKVEKLIATLEGQFRYFYNLGLTLITLKNYNQEILEKYSGREGILLEQKSRKNYRLLVASDSNSDAIA